MSGLGFKVSTGLLAIAGVGICGFLMWRNNQPTTLGEKLIYYGKPLLNTETNDEEHKSKWLELVKQYEDGSNSNKIDNLTLNAPSNNDADRTQNINLLKEKCRNLFSTSVGTRDFSQKEALAKNWCIVGAEGFKNSLF